MTAWQKVRLILAYFFMGVALAVAPDCAETAQLIAALEDIHFPGGRTR